MRLSWAMLSLLVLASPALANHWPPEVEYLNGTQLIEMHPATDLRSGERSRWEVRDDELAGIRYYVRCRGDERIDRVWRLARGDGSAGLIYSVDDNRTARCQHSH